MNQQPTLLDVRSAVDRGDWQRAIELLDEFDPDGTESDALELRAQAHYGGGDFEASIAA